jgi:Glycosyltransferase family 10 (fucosyltransferase) C-term
MMIFAARHHHDDHGGDRRGQRRGLQFIVGISMFVAAVIAVYSILPQLQQCHTQLSESEIAHLLSIRKQSPLTDSLSTHSVPVSVSSDSDPFPSITAPHLPPARPQPVDVIASDKMKTQISSTDASPPTPGPAATVVEQHIESTPSVSLSIQPAGSNSFLIDDYSCDIVRWQMLAKDASETIPALMCSTGGYDPCPPVVKCNGADWGTGRNFEARIQDTMNDQKQAGAMIASADVVVMSHSVAKAYVGGGGSDRMPWHSGRPWSYPHQSKTFVSLESGAFHNELRRPSFFTHFDFSFGFATKPDLFSHYLSYIRSDTNLLLGRGPVPFQGREKPPPLVNGKVPIAVSLHSTMTTREGILREMSKLIPTHHMGSIMRNREKVPGQFNSAGPRNKIAEFAKYQFCFALENAREPGYVTEKLFDAFEAGCIPLYYGAPDVHEIWRYPDSFINIADFPTLKAAAEHVMKVAANKDLYDSYHAWRKIKPLPEWLQTLLSNGIGVTPCRICMAHWNRFSNPPTIAQIQKTKKLRSDKTARIDKNTLLNLNDPRTMPPSGF